MRRVVFLLLGALAVWGAWPRGGAPGVSVIGDGARGVVAALDLPDDASLDVVLLRREAALRHLPETARLCRGRCGPGLTVLWVLGPTGGVRLVFEMSEMEGIRALDRGDPLPEPIASCLVRVITAELSQRWGDPGEGCAGSRRKHIVLPYGL